MRLASRMASVRAVATAMGSARVRQAAIMVICVALIGPRVSTSRSTVRTRAVSALTAAVRSPVLQWAIYEKAANAIYPMWVRELAGAAFEESIERFGVLLRGPQIQRMYDRYNASEFEPTESQELLGRLIDAVVEAVRDR